MNDSFSGIHPNYYTAVPNRITLDLLTELPKPWPEAGVALYLRALAGFGQRTILLKRADHTYLRVTLQRGEFLNPEVRLARLAGRSRNTVRRILLTQADLSRKLYRGRQVYRIKALAPEQHLPDSGSKSFPAKTSGEAVEELPSAGAASRSIPEQLKEIISKERITRENRPWRDGDLHSLFQKNNQAAPEDKKSGRILTLLHATGLQESDRRRLMARYGITEVELEAARRETYDPP